MVPDFYRNKLKSSKLLLNTPVTLLSEMPDRSFVVSYSRQGSSTPIKIQNKTFDFVFNTADTDQVLKMMNFKDLPLQKMCQANVYTATIAVHVEIDTTTKALLQEGTAPGMCSEPGLLQKLGGVMFHSAAQNVALGGHDIVSLFARTEAARDILAKAGNQSIEKIGSLALGVLLDDLDHMARSQTGSRSLSNLVAAIRRGSIINTQAWPKALPSFGPGYMATIANYKLGSFGRLNRHFYLGQALYGRSIAMVIPGVERDFSTIKAALDNF